MAYALGVLPPCMPFAGVLPPDAIPYAGVLPPEAPHAGVFPPEALAADGVLPPTPAA